ncbi:MAG: DNA alkylation repair protein [Anaerolineae bacterium]|jgi:3-methyladenine DNA glycosylase AlkD|nr:DNA alkylation repair protein [Anaerolineae bacterium]MBT7072747.1 DNA alkylation repair protein [Anaerolineae bacterium]MBT7324642.1 DNA alkylation repair protein [Anaerolineae bacterium]
MTAEKILKELEEAGTAQNRKVYARHGVGTQMFGVSFKFLRQKQKEYKGEHELALKLWRTGYHEARLLAAMIADPQKMDAEIAETWVQDLNNYVQCDEFSSLIARTAFSQEKMEVWTLSDAEWIGRAGWHLLANIAQHDAALPDKYFIAYLERIEKEIHQRKNRVRDGMNNALIAIGIRNSLLTARAMQSAEKIGKVEVDHGQTSCKTPDAAGYIEKTLAYREKKKTKKK